jgi:hypothetical protein
MVTPPPQQTPSDVPEPAYVIGYRDDMRRIRYYRGVNGATGKASTGAKRDAVRIDRSMGETILRQLPAIDARDWQLVKHEKRCKFA